MAAVGGRLLRVEGVAEDAAERPHQPLRKIHVTLDNLVYISSGAPPDRPYGSVSPRLPLTPQPSW